MSRILVTTDLSVNSKAGIRYAIQLAQKSNAELIFLHIYKVWNPTVYKDVVYDPFTHEEKNEIMDELHRFVNGIYKTMQVKPGKIKFSIEYGLDVADGILNFARKNSCDYICMSTQGAGGLKRLFGSIAAKLISVSEIPVLCIPKNYRVRPIKHLLYASDMSNYENELKKIVAFAKPVKAPVEMVHMSFPYENLGGENIVEKTLSKKLNHKIGLHYNPRDIDNTLLDDLGKAIRKSKPSLVVMFTNQKRSFFEKVFLSSKTKEFAYRGRVPLLVYNK